MILHQYKKILQNILGSHKYRLTTSMMFDFLLGYQYIFTLQIKRSYIFKIIQIYHVIIKRSNTL